MGEYYDVHAKMHESFPRVDSGSLDPKYTNRLSVNIEGKDNSERKPIRDRYGDNRSDLPHSAEDNEYAYARVRDAK